MSELRYPNESKAYRDAREALRKDEQELLDKVKVVAAKRRMLPHGGELKEDYVFQWAGGGEVGGNSAARELLRAVRRQEHVAALFMDVRPKLGQALSVLHVADGWVRPDLVPGQPGRCLRRDRQSPRRKDQCLGKGARLVADPSAVWLRVDLSEGLRVSGRDRRHQQAAMHAFRKRDGKIFHFWSAEAGVDTVWPYWN